MSAPAGLNTEGGRKIVLRDLQEQVPLVDLDFFFKDGILPDLAAEIDLTAVLASPQVTGEIQSGKWKAYKDKSCYNGHEDKVFGHLQSIIANIRTAAQGPNVTPTLRYDCRPSSIPKSSYRDNKSRPDSYGILFNASRTLPEWVDIAVPGEFKKDTTPSDINDVRVSIFYLSAQFSPAAELVQDYLVYVPPHA